MVLAAVAGGGVEREQGEESERSEEAKELKGATEQEVEGRWCFEVWF